MLMRVGGESAAKPSAVSPAVSHPVHPPHPASVSHPVHPAASSGKSSAYTVHSGDTLSGIASRNHLSLSALEKDNPQIKNPNLIYSGESVHLPQDTVSLSPHAQGLKGETHPANTNTGAYTVHSGDTLSGIASRNHLSLSALEKDNPQIKNPNLILPGEVLHLGSGVNSASSPGPSHLTRSAPFISPAANSPATQPIPNASPNQPIPAKLIVYNFARPTTGVMV